MFFTNSCGIVIRLSRNFFCKEPKGWCKPAKKAYDLVQRKRKIKALRVSVHQVCAGCRATDLRLSTKE